MRHIFPYLCSETEISTHTFVMNKTRQPERLQSLDTLRGFDMFFIMGGGTLFIALSTLFPTPFFLSLSEQMVHASWHGLHWEDVIFPLFLFVAGISFPYSLEKQHAAQMSRVAIHRKIVMRGLTLVFLGCIYNGLLNFDFAHMRYCSVLGRIGLAWMLAALIFVHTPTKPRIAITATILVGYWLLLALFPAPDGGGAGAFTMEGCLVGYIDRLTVPGRLLLKVHDPEGLFSTLPAIGTALLGMFAGEWIKLQRENISESKKVCGLIAVGACLVLIGLLWNTVFPINKNLWSSSFVCLVGGLSTLLFAAFHYVVDVRGCRGWTLFFRVIGMNSITIYLAQRFVDISFTSEFLLEGVANVLPVAARDTVFALGYIALCWGFLYFLYRQRIFLKV